MHTLPGTSSFTKQLQAFRMMPQGRSSIVLRQKEEKELERGRRENGRRYCKWFLCLSSISHPKHPGRMKFSQSLKVYWHFQPQSAPAKYFCTRGPHHFQLYLRCFESSITRNFLREVRAICLFRGQLGHESIEVWMLTKQALFHFYCV